jgi:hypothetical protein
MKVTNIIEHEDGSATITLDMSKEEHQTVMEGALLRGIALGLSSNKPADWDGFTPEQWRTIVNNAIEAKRKEAAPDPAN